MEPYFLLALSALGMLILIGVSMLNARLKKIGETQDSQGEKIVELRSLIVGVNGTPGLVASVRDLHAWRNTLQAAELNEANAELKRMRDDERRHGPSDRRDA